LGNLNAAKRWYEQNKNIGPHYLNPLNREQHELTLARILLVMQQPEEALKLLDALESDIRENNHTKNLIELLILTSWAHHSANNEKLSVEVMEQALQLASGNGFIALFADEVGPIGDIVKNCLNANIGSRFMSDITGILNIKTVPLDNATRTAKQNKTITLSSEKEILTEPLSTREIEVLRLIDAGLANKEIASKLFLAPATVKAHIRNIYGKLDVKSRTEALARSRKLELL
jgi:LuxR family maltose regulon positive regulatory protein